MKLVLDIELECLGPATTIADMEALCRDAVASSVTAVCVPPMFVKKAKELLAGTSVKVATVIGFPYGYHAIESKLSETVLAIVDGADELNVMINLLAVKNKDWEYLAKEINHILSVVRKSGKKIKMIIEAGLMTDAEIITCCDIYGAAGVDFIQVSTGVAGVKVDIQVLKLIRTHLADTVQLKMEVADHVVGDLVTAGVNRISADYKTDYSTLSLLSGTVFEKELPAKN